MEQTSKEAEAAMIGGRLGPAVTLPQKMIASICGNTAILGNVALQVAPPGGQTCNWYRWRHLFFNRI